MELVEEPDDKSNSIPIGRCRELLSEEADSLTRDRDDRARRQGDPRHAATMAWDPGRDVRERQPFLFERSIDIDTYDRHAEKLREELTLARIDRHFGHLEERQKSKVTRNHNP